MWEISPNIHRIEIPLGNRLLAQHVLVGERVFLVDTGVRNTPEDYIFPYLQKVGMAPEDVAAAIITHPDSDHFGGNAALKKWCPRCLILAHAEDAELVESPETCLARRYDFALPYGFPLPAGARARIRDAMGEATAVDIHVTGGERLRLTGDKLVEIHHCPGHSQGHLIVYDPAERVAVVTDAVLGTSIPTALGRPAFAPTYRFLKAYFQTIQKIRGLNLRLLLTSHFPVIEGSGNVSLFLDESERFANELEKLVLSTIQAAAEAVSLTDIIRSIKDRLASWDDPENPFVSYSLCYPLLPFSTRESGKAN